MKVTIVKANLRLSKHIDDCWASCELAAEASLESDEIWEDAQAALYRSLKGQLASLFAKNAHSRAPETVIQPPDEVQVTQRPPINGVHPAHYCELHEETFKERRKGSRVWWSHRAGNGWCNES
jgi:hypothetical protein